MTWAPRGIFKTMSLSVGRSTRKWRPVDPVIVRPSSPPIIESWAITPAWVWKVAPATKVMRYRRSLGSIRRMRSPASRACDTARGSGFRVERRIVGVAYRDQYLLARRDLEGVHELVFGPQGATEHVRRTRDDQPGPVAG